MHIHHPPPKLTFNVHFTAKTKANNAVRNESKCDGVILNKTQSFLAHMAMKSFHLGAILRLSKQQGRILWQLVLFCPYWDSANYSL